MALQDQLCTEWNDLKSQVTTLTSERDQAVAAVAPLQAQVAQLTQERDAAIAQKNSLQAQLSSETAAKNALQTQLDAANTQIANLNSQLAACQAALEDCDTPDPDPDPPSGDDLDSLLRPPANKLLLGVQQETSGLTGWTAEAGKAPHIYHRYATSGSNFVSLLNSTPSGMIPLINFKPTGGMGLATYNQIIAGQANAAIDQAADAVIAYGKKMFVAPMHEPENDGEAADDPEYAQAFRFIVERMRARGATNAVFVWNMMGAAVHGSRYNGLYPGDDVVDWLAADLYIQTSTTVDTWAEFLNQPGWPTSPSGWYNWAKTKNKPIMLAEWGIGPSIVPATPTKMFGNTEMQSLVTNFPLLKALVYWNALGTVDYRVTHANWPNGLLSTWVNRPEFQVDISETAK